MSDRFDDTDPNCPFHAVINPLTFDGEHLRVGTELSFVSSKGVTTVKIKSVEVQPGTGLVGVTF